ncbi:MAG: DUF3472 domain-containing protein, partial [Planctomycetales bacterium]|nr:DUF3472 domain-containing protein [Planctomycetales bacterium]
SFYDFDWKLGQSVRFVVYAKPDGLDRTQYAGYIHVPGENRWQHMATFSTLTGGELLRGLYSFVEDFRRDGESATIVHRAHFGNGWVLAKSDDAATWKPLTTGRFTADSTPTKNIDSGRVADRIFLQTGDDTKNDHTKLRDSTSLETADRKPPLDLPVPFDDGARDPNNAIRILSYNIKHGRGNDDHVDLTRAAVVIRRLNPDIVALQEVDHLVGRSGTVAEAEELARLTGLEHHLFGSFFDHDGGQYGMAILSRYPLRDVQNLKLPEGAEPRSSLLVTVNTARPFRLANVHFYRTEAERLAQATTVRDALAPGADIPCVIAGDFNSYPNSRVLQLFDEWTVPSKGDDHLTFPSQQPDREIDYIMFRPTDAFAVAAVDVIDEPLVSDHRPLTLELRPRVEQDLSTPP